MTRRKTPTHLQARVAQQAVHAPDYLRDRRVRGHEDQGLPWLPFQQVGARGHELKEGRLFGS